MTTRFAHETLPQRVVFASFEAAEHVPGDVAERARKAAKEHDADVLVSVGGGSATGLAKAVALTTGLPIVAVPTTYAGSEATNAWDSPRAAARPLERTPGCCRGPSSTTPA